MSAVKLTTKQRDMLAALEGGPKLAGRWDFSGSPVPGQLRRLGLIEKCDHPDVMDRRTGFHAEAYRLTEGGVAAAKTARGEA